MTEEELFADIEPMVQSLGLVLVDCRMQQTRHGIAVQLVIHKALGLGTDDCAKVHRMVAPRLEIIYDNRDVRLEVTSPGLERKFRLPREYTIFTGRGVHVITKDSKEYHGILVGSDASTCTVSIKGQDVVLKLDAIAKTKLEYIEEGQTS